MGRVLTISAICFFSFLGCNKDIQDKPILFPYEDENFKISVIQSSNFNDISGIHFFNEQQGIAVSFDGPIVKTNNGGATWVTKFNRKKCGLFDQLMFLDLRYGFIYGSSDLWRTTDSGNTWGISKSVPNSAFRAMDFNNKGEIFACTDHPDNQILKSVDTGRTWSVITSFKFRINKIVFCDHAGFVIGDEGSIFKSADDGNTWTKVASLGAFLFDINVIDNVGYCLTDQNGNYKTEDNGETWVRMNVIINGTQFVSNLAMFTPDNVFIFGNGGVSGNVKSTDYFGFSQTSNAGKDWHTLVFGIPEQLYSTSYIDCNSAYGVLGRQLIKFTMKGIGGSNCKTIPKDDSAINGE